MDLADLTRDLETLQRDALGAIEAAPDAMTLDEVELDVLGKKGRLTGVLRGIGALAAGGPAQGRRHRQHRPGRHRDRDRERVASTCAAAS